MGIGLIAQSTTAATELHLSNGDRVTGSVIMRVEGKIHFRSDLLGDLVVNETDAAVVEAPDTPVESLSGLPPIDLPRGKKNATAATLAAGSSAPTAAPPPKWKGKIELGFLNQSGRNEINNTSIRVESEKNTGPDSLRLTGRYLYGDSNGVTASDRADASFRWRRDMSPRVFSQTLSSYAKDKVTEIDLNLEQNGSLGYQLVEADAHKVDIGAGLTLQYRDAENTDSRINYFGEVFQDYTYKINGHFTVFQAINLLYSPSESARLIRAKLAAGDLSPEAENFKVRFNSTLQGKVSESISLNLRYEFEYDNAILNKEARSDQRITSSIGYAF
ncbi:MAG: DUF481 domain-containing protein [Opitutaceae bacterium]|nr:DUF481 domain-containing protein [Opitutaceae bacterium]